MILYQKHFLHLITALGLGLVAAACDLEYSPGELAEERGALGSESLIEYHRLDIAGYQPDTGNAHDWWEDGIVDAAAGDTLSFSCTGGIRPWPGGPVFDCDGDPGNRWDLAIAGTRCDFGSLVGKIGLQGTPFCIGGSGTYVVPAGTPSGRLFLGFNDGVQFMDNSGSWTVSIVFERANTCGGGGWSACSEECPCPVGEGDCDTDDDCVAGAICLHDAGPAFGFASPEMDVCSTVCPTLGVGAVNYCSANCPCAAREGDCDGSAECAPGLICVNNVGAQYGFAADTDVCLDPCDVGGVGGWDSCSASCPCAAQEGDCDGNTECAPGLTCVHNVGAQYGFPVDMDVCLDTCHPSAAGGWDYCSAGCPCANGGGDCDSDAECLPGLLCVRDVGAQEGYAPGVDVCLALCPAGSDVTGESDVACEPTGPDCESGDICARFGSCLAVDPPAGVDPNDWLVSNPDWNIIYDNTNGCYAYHARRGMYPQNSERVRRLLDSVALAAPEFLSSEVRQACAVLDQALALCRDGEYLDQGELEPAVTRRHSCHPNAEYGCDPHDPDFAGILRNASPSMTFDNQTCFRPRTYCSGQVIGDEGYAARVSRNPPSWTCTDADATRLAQRLADLKADNVPLLGDQFWPQAFDVLDGVSHNRCRYAKALIDCVYPSIAPQGGAVLCDTASNYGTPPSNRLDDCHVSDPEDSNWPEYCGVRYPALGEYCFKIVQSTGGTGAHADGRAADFNNASGEQSPNGGNLVQCDLTMTSGHPNWRTDPDGLFCTNRSRTPHVDLPPAFVSIMETCGFTWGGHWTDAESRYLGCDPMHFELPETGSVPGICSQ